MEAVRHICMREAVTPVRCSGPEWGWRCRCVGSWEDTGSQEVKEPEEPWDLTGRNHTYRWGERSWQRRK